VSGLTARVRPAASGNAPWLLLSVLVGGTLGVATARAPLLGVALIALPGVALLFLRPAWLPPVLVVTVFAESLEVGGLTISRLSAPLALAVVLARLATTGVPRYPRRELLWAVTAYVGFAFASALWTVNPDNSLLEGGTGSALASLALSLVYMGAFAVLVETRDDLRRLGVTVWVVAVVLGVVAIVQYLAGYDRAVAYAGDANFFAALQVIALPTCLLVAAQAERAGQRLVGLLGVGIVVGSVLTTLSRGGILALLGVIALMALLPARVIFRSRRFKRIALTATGIGAAVLLVVAFGDIQARGESLFNTAEGGSGRANLWRAAIAGWEEHQLRGLGYGAFTNESNDLLRRTPGVDFDAYRLRESGQVAHSAYLGTLVELGVIGLALLLGVLASLVTTLRWAARTARRQSDQLVAAAAQALLVSVAGFVVVSFFLSTETDRGLWVLLGTAIALARIAATRAKMPPDPR
jgi:O-antigen ligase